MTKLDDTEDVELIEDEGETVDEFVVGKRCLRTRVSPFAKEGQFAASAQKIKRLRMLETSISQYQNM